MIVGRPVCDQGHLYRKRRSCGRPALPSVTEKVVIREKNGLPKNYMMAVFLSPLI
ncbi:MAG: hypothetical protein PHI28_17080 [Mangrovibacterium sp.]|nr:hypothetical protein [Mangrovibacterium sp.]